MKFAHRFILFSLLFLSVSQSHGIVEAHKQGPRLFSFHPKQSSPPQKQQDYNSKEERLIRSALLAAIAGTIYTVSRDNPAPFLGTTLGDYGQSISLGIAWDAAKRLYCGNSVKDRCSDVAGTVIRKVGCTTMHAGLLWAEKKTHDVLEQRGYPWAASFFEQASGTSSQSGVVAGLITAQCLHYSGYHQAARLLRPNGLKTFLWSGLGNLGHYGIKKMYPLESPTHSGWFNTSALAAVQFMQLLSPPEQETTQVIHYVKTSLERMHFNELVNTLSETPFATVHVNFPDNSIAQNYYQREFSFTYSRTTAGLIKQLQNGTIMVTDGALPIDVRAARNSCFFQDWQNSMQKKLKELEEQQRQESKLTNEVTTALLTNNPCIVGRPPLTTHTLAVTLTELFDVARSLMGTKLGQQTETHQYDDFRPLLAQPQEAHAFE